MRKLTLAAVLAISAPVALSGCAYKSPQQQEANACQIIGPKAMIGGLAGAAGGAAVGAAAGGGRGAAIGAGVGLLAGLIAGHMADTEDCTAAQAALEQQLFAANSDSTISWESKSGHNGQYSVIGDVYDSSNGEMCRRTESLSSSGSADSASPVVVCRQSDGDYVYSKG